MIKTGGEVKDWLVFDSRGLGVAVAPDCRGPVALVHTRSWRWWIHPETSDITAETSEKREKGLHEWNIFPADYFYCSIFQVHTWGAPDSCGPGWGEGCLWGPAPGASEEASLAESPQSARCSSSRHTEEETKTQFSLISIQGTTIEIQHNSRWILIDLRRELLIFISNFPN